MSIIVILAYFLFLGFVGYYFRNQKTNEEFLIANRDRSWLYVSASLFTLIGGGELVTMTSIAYTIGFAGLYLFIGFAIGFVVLAFLSERIRNHSETSLLHSLPDYFYSKYGKMSGLLTTILSFLAFFTLLVLQFSVGAQIISSLSGWSYLLSVVAIGAIISVYLSLGGYKGVLTTDMVQSLFMLVLLPIILWALFNSSTSTFSIVEKLQFGQYPLISVSLFFTGLFTVLASADVWQRMYSAKDINHTKKALWLAGGLFVIFGVGLIGLGAFAQSQLPGIDGNEAFVVSVTTLLSKEMASVTLLLVFSAILSTADTEVFLLSSIASREYNRWKNGYKSNFHASKQTKLPTIRTAIIAITIMSLIVSLFTSDHLVKVYTLLLGVIMVISPSVLFSFFFKLNDKIIALSLITSFVAFIILILTEKLNEGNLVLIVIPSTLFNLFFMLISYFRKK